MHGSQKRQKQHNKFTGYINLQSPHSMAQNPFLTSLKKNPIMPLMQKTAKVQEIKAEYRRIANQIVEEAMIIANICAAQIFTRTGKTGIFNTHSGFDKKFLENAHHFNGKLANEQNQTELAERYSVENLATLKRLLPNAPRY